MQAMPAVDTSLLERSLPHKARAFAGPPGAAHALVLLAEIAGGACAFAPVPMDRPLALYGAGSLGRLAREFLTSVGHDFALVIDRNAEALARDPTWAGIEIRHPDAVSPAAKRAHRFAVSIVTSPYAPIEQSLRENGFDDVVPFYDLAESFRALHPLSNGWLAPALTAGDLDSAAGVLAHWHDDMSRAHHLQFLAWRRLREEWTFAGAPVVTDNRFFIPEVTGILYDDEVFVDAGAHHGSVTGAFIRQTGGAFGAIAAIEPDLANRAILEDNLGAWLPRDALGLAPSFLKLHLEGAELAALKGARETLRAHRPIVAATVYHNADGIWRTPLWLMENLENYRFLFRGHGWCGTGAVVYAIPGERHA